jgi:hypothetical protein
MIPERSRHSSNIANSLPPASHSGNGNPGTAPHGGAPVATPAVSAEMLT